MSNKSDFVALHLGSGYSSELESVKGERRSVSAFDAKPNTRPPSLGGHIPGTKFDLNSRFETIRTRELNKMYGGEWRNMDAWTRHQKLVSDYLTYYGGKMTDFQQESQSKVVTDFDILKQEHCFIRSEDEDKNPSWEKRVAINYYQKLFKEYCLADMTFYKQGKMGLRWRTQEEVLKGKGQFVCGNKKCTVTENLKSYEVNFGYMEQGKVKQALVKLRVCRNCAYKLNYQKIKRLEQQQKEKEKEKEKKEKEEENNLRKEKESDVVVGEESEMGKHRHKHLKHKPELNEEEEKNESVEASSVKTKRKKVDQDPSQIRILNSLMQNDYAQTNAALLSESQSSLSSSSSVVSSSSSSSSTQIVPLQSSSSPPKAQHIDEAEKEKEAQETETQETDFVGPKPPEPEAPVEAPSSLPTLHDRFEVSSAKMFGSFLPPESFSQSPSSASSSSRAVHSSSASSISSTTSSTRSSAPSASTSTSSSSSRNRDDEFVSEKDFFAGLFP
eukprot:TRINITY_DN2610_c0_g1_i1.p1 TRINITY_DN2610_c0_g1~~TRINITY_DN2610_c0_g1_i1.p1  ORF type:complete len:500 (-),score=151.15 TRINITY_DN2610_c0_g1_i1:1492-2991(-)